MNSSHARLAVMAGLALSVSLSASPALAEDVDVIETPLGETEEQVVGVEDEGVSASPSTNTIVVPDAGAEGGTVLAANQATGYEAGEPTSSDDAETPSAEPSEASDGLVATDTLAQEPEDGVAPVATLMAAVTSEAKAAPATTAETTELAAAAEPAAANEVEPEPKTTLTWDGTTYRYRDGDAPIAGWHYFSSQEIGQLGASGSLGEGWRFFDANGAMVTGEAYIPQDNLAGSAKHWYHFDESTGRASYGWKWLEAGHKWVYYHDTCAYMLYGEQLLYSNNQHTGDRHWYYFDDVTGATTYGWKWLDAGHKWVYYDGTPQTGGMGWMYHGEAYVRQDNNVGSPSYWYYFDDVTGATTYGWKDIKAGSGTKRVYYLPVVGYMVHGWHTEGNVTMHMDEATGALRHIEVNPPKLVNQQADGAPMGCEAGALYMALQEKGHVLDMTYREFLATMPLASDGNPNHGFSGSPYNSYAEYSSIYPAPLATWANRYGKAQDISGSSVQQVIDWIWSANPVVVYVTGNYAAPRWVNCSFGRAVDNAHVMTATGYDADTDQLQMHDPSHARRYWVSRSTFAQAYNAQHFAVVVTG